MQYLYKFKSCNERDVDAIEKNSLWISTYEYLNDESEFPIFSNDNSLDDDDLEKYKSEMFVRNCCASFSMSPYKKCLWNQYANALKGIAISYQYNEIKNSLKKNYIKDYYEGKVIYDGNTFPVNKKDIKSKNYPNNNVNVFFHKDEYWKEENEYRYVFKYLKTSKYFASNEGLLLKGIKPHHIFIGYRINKEYRERLITYCKKNDICLYEVKRNNKTKDNRGYYKRVIVSKRNKKDKEGNIYTTLLK